MAGFRAIKDRARRALHEKLEVPAYYFRRGDMSSPLLCTVRVHTRSTDVGDMKGTSFDFAENVETVPKLVFMRDQLPPDLPNNDDYVVLSRSEGYRITVVDPSHGITQSAGVTRLTTEKMGLFAVPPAES